MIDSTPISGKHLTYLKGLLGKTNSTLLWLFGWSSPQLSKYTHRGNGELTGTHSVLTRLLIDRPDLCPLPSHPTAPEVFELINEITPISEKEFSILLGMQPGSKDRLQDPDENLSAPVYNLLLIIKTQLESAKSKAEKEDFISYYKNIIEAEGISRGIEPDQLWKKGGWRTAALKKK